MCTNGTGNTCNEREVTNGGKETLLRKQQQQLAAAAAEQKLKQQQQPLPDLPIAGAEEITQRKAAMEEVRRAHDTDVQLSDQLAAEASAAAKAAQEELAQLEAHKIPWAKQLQEQQQAHQHAIEEATTRTAQQRRLRMMRD